MGENGNRTAGSAVFFAAVITLLCAVIAVVALAFYFVPRYSISLSVIHVWSFILALTVSALILILVFSIARSTKNERYARYAKELQIKREREIAMATQTEDLPRVQAKTSVEPITVGNMDFGLLEDDFEHDAQVEDLPGIIPFSTVLENGTEIEDLSLEVSDEFEYVSILDADSPAIKLIDSVVLEDGLVIEDDFKIPETLADRVRSEISSAGRIGYVSSFALLDAPVDDPCVDCYSDSGRTVAVIPFCNAVEAEKILNGAKALCTGTEDEKTILAALGL